MKNTKNTLLPFSLTAGVIIADQISKIIVSRVLTYGRPVELLGDFLRLTYVANPNIAFSIGRDMAQAGRIILSMVLPVIVVGILIYFYFCSKDITKGRRWILAAIIGGGLANYADRLFRPGGVIDFIDFKFYGIFGFARWPVFNLADSTVVIAGILLLISFLRKGEKKEHE